MTTNKQKKRLRERQRIANREVGKEKQIQDLINDLDGRPTNIFTGQPVWTEKDKN